MKIFNNTKFCNFVFVSSKDYFKKRTKLTIFFYSHFLCCMLNIFLPYVYFLSIIDFLNKTTLIYRVQISLLLTLPYVYCFFFQVDSGRTNSNYIKLEEFKCPSIIFLSMSIHVLYFFICFLAQYGYNGLTPLPIVREFLYTYYRDSTI